MSEREVRYCRTEGDAGIVADGGAREILVSDVVRGMARSSAGVVFEDRGEGD